jgi:hypothetical protein
LLKDSTPDIDPERTRELAVWLVATRSVLRTQCRKEARCSNLRIATGSSARVAEGMPSRHGSWARRGSSAFAGRRAAPVAASRSGAARRSFTRVRDPRSSPSPETTRASRHLTRRSPRSAGYRCCGMRCRWSLWRSVRPLATRPRTLRTLDTTPRACAPGANIADTSRARSGRARQAPSEMRNVLPSVSATVASWKVRPFG